MRFAAFALLPLWLMLAAGINPAFSQDVGVVQSDILVLDPDRLFAETRFGKRLNQDYLAKRDELIAHNRKLEAELEAEEKRLTDLRETTSPEEFKALADAFDEKVRGIRHESDRAVRTLEQSRERAPVIFMRAVEEVLVDIMQDAGGAVVLDVRTVLLRANVIDITDLAIARIDEHIGNGPPDVSLQPE